MPRSRLVLFLLAFTVLVLPVVPPVSRSARVGQGQPVTLAQPATVVRPSSWGHIGRFPQQRMAERWGRWP